MLKLMKSMANENQLDKMRREDIFGSLGGMGPSE
jgi:hypothetical protein